jgi:transposase
MQRKRGAPIRSKSPDIEARRKRAVKLRVDGHSYREIADKLRVSVQTAFADVAAVMERTQLAADKLAGEIRSIDLERLDIATKALLPKVKRGDLRAVEKLVAVIARRAKLVGADAPERSELSGPEGAPIEIDARKTLLERLASLADSAAAGGEAQGDSGEPQPGGSESSPV